ncbi:hypothetical protein D3C75_904240 [compost metagenome]
MRGLALGLLEVGGIQHHREAGQEDGGSLLVQVAVGGLGRGTGVQLGLVGGREQALALDIRAQADGAEGFHQAHGGMALADRGNTVGDGQEACWDGAVAFRQRGIVAVLAQDHHALDRVLLLGQAEQADLGADHGAVGLVERQQGQPLVVAGQLQVGIDEAPRQRLEAAILEIHGEEGGVADYVDQAERFVELDAVEQ